MLELIQQCFGSTTQHIFLLVYYHCAAFVQIVFWSEMEIISLDVILSVTQAPDQISKCVPYKSYRLTCNEQNPQLMVGRGYKGS